MNLLENLPFMPGIDNVCFLLLIFPLFSFDSLTIYLQLTCNLLCSSRQPQGMSMILMLRLLSVGLQPCATTPSRIHNISVLFFLKGGVSLSNLLYQSYLLLQTSFYLSLLLIFMSC